MLHFFQLLLILINIDQETFLNWFGVTSLRDSLDLSGSIISFQTLGLILNSFWSTLNEGLSLSDIEGALFFILFIRLVILAFRYNVKTSFFITFIGFIAGYLWYRHLIDLISIYRNSLLQIPFFENLGLDALRLSEYYYQTALNDKSVGENLRWYDVGPTIYYACLKGIINVDSETGFRSYIDPLSMAISNLDESTKVTVVPIYYKFYNQILPRILNTLSQFWQQLSGIAAYGLITRIGKRYCPYLIRWHWTFLLVVSIFEPFIEYFIFRAEFFEEFILNPQLILVSADMDAEQLSYAQNIFDFYQQDNALTSSYQSLFVQSLILKSVFTSIIMMHVGLILFALFHAIWGQYFYLPFLTENVELHIGPRPSNSIYSGGYSSWQNPGEKEKSLNRTFPKLWYGWFGRGTQGSNSLFTFFTSYIRKNLLIFQKRFK